MLGRLRDLAPGVGVVTTKTAPSSSSSADDLFSMNIAPAGEESESSNTTMEETALPADKNDDDSTKESPSAAATSADGADSSSGRTTNHENLTDETTTSHHQTNQHNKPKLFSRWLQPATLSEDKQDGGEKGNVEGNTVSAADEKDSDSKNDDSSQTQKEASDQASDEKEDKQVETGADENNNVTNERPQSQSIWTRFRPVIEAAAALSEDKKVSNTDTMTGTEAVSEVTTSSISSTSGNEASNDEGGNHNMVSMLSRFRKTASKVIEESAAKIAEASQSEDAADASKKEKTPEELEEEEINMKIQEAILNDPKILGLNAQILQVQSELDSIKATVKHAEKQRRQEIATLRQHVNGKSRELWFNTQKMRRFNGLNEYKEVIVKCTLPEHDSEPATINAEAKLVRCQHQSGILDHQMTIVHEFQEGMIDYLYTTALPGIKAEQQLASEVGQAQVDKMIKSEQFMVQLFEECLGLQRKIMAKYKLRELEHSRGLSHEHTHTEQQVEHLKVMAGEIPVMERDPELRDSAKKRLEERHKLLEMRGDRRRSRDEELLKAALEVQDEEKTALEKANEQIASFSSHSVDLLLQDEEDDEAQEEHKGIEETTIELKREEPTSSSDGSQGEFGDESEVGGQDSVPQAAMRGRKEEVVAATIEEDKIPEPPGGKEPAEQSQEIPPPPVSPRISTANLARLRARRAARQNGEETSEHSQSEGGEDNLEPVSPLSTSGRRMLGGSRHRPTGAGSRSELLERARSARLNNGPVKARASDQEATTTTRVRPSLGSKAMSSREFASRRVSATRPSRGLGSSEHRASTRLSGTSDHNARARPSATATPSEDRQARMERLASRRRVMDTSAHKSPRTTEGKRPTLSAERRAQLRSGLSNRNVTNRSTAKPSDSQDSHN